MTDASLPLPPVGLATRVGTVDGADPLQFYIEEGARLRRVIEALVPADWSWHDRRVLDFGCGSARVLRHFAGEAEHGAFWGCDIDRDSIEWDQANLSPPFSFFRSDSSPPLPLPGNSLDLIWAMSVFTHIADRWSDWLVEMHRLLAPGGVLIASFLGEGMWKPLVGEPFVEDEVGMSVLHHWEGPDAWVFHSEWWLRSHWGRAFDVVEVMGPPRAPDGSPQITHSYIAARKRDVEITRDDLERVDVRELRELAGLQTSLRLARNELAAFASQHPDQSGHERLRRRASALKRIVRRSKQRR